MKNYELDGQMFVGVYSDDCQMSAYVMFDEPLNFRDVTYWS